MDGRHHRGWGLAVAALGLSLGAGCAMPRAAAPMQAMAMERGASASTAVLLETQAGRFRVEAEPRDEDSALQVRRAVENAGPKLSRWGALNEPVTVRVHPTHKALERAAGRSGYAWLRAWARYDAVEVQAPHTWGLLATRQDEVDELLLHELTHSVMYQLAGDRDSWRRKQIPDWFREGMASYTSQQGYRWYSLEQLTRFLQDHPGVDPLGAPAELYRDDSTAVYGAAHHAFTFLVKRYGEDCVRALLREMGQGPAFPEAFHHAVGLPVESFVRDFDRYVRWRGFKGGRLLMQRARPPAPAAE
ncbi:hypothetical protein P2318_22365 [Myxococcaceae bacterium GXIMD 01537]